MIVHSIESLIPPRPVPLGANGASRLRGLGEDDSDHESQKQKNHDDDRNDGQHALQPRVGALMCCLCSWRLVAGPFDMRTHAVAPTGAAPPYRTQRSR